MAGAGAVRQAVTACCRRVVWGVVGVVARVRCRAWLAGWRCGGGGVVRDGGGLVGGEGEGVVGVEGEAFVGGGGVLDDEQGDVHGVGGLRLLFGAGPSVGAFVAVGAV